MLGVGSTAILNWALGGVLDIGFSSCTVPNYPLLVSEYFRYIPEVLRLSGSFRSCPGVQKLIQN